MKHDTSKYTIRKATIEDLEAIAAVEAECFPPSEAATKEQFVGRLENYAPYFWLMFDGDKLISFVDGFVSDSDILTDEMFADPTLHKEEGAFQMIFGVNTIPAYRNQGCAGTLIMEASNEAKERGRKGVILTCKEHMISYYAQFGFVNEGLSGSEHGNETWYQMGIRF